MLGGADNPNGELPSYITGADTYLLKQWEALNVYCSNCLMEIDNNIAENALRGWQ